MTKIPFGKPNIGSNELHAIQKVMNGPILTHGPECQEFEAKFADYVGTEYAISTSNCTTALHLCLIAHGVGPGDEVILPAMTHVATSHAIEHCGATPVFVDVDINTGCIDPQEIEKAITSKSRAIIVVHFVGLPCDMTTINELGKLHKLPIIEDAATALGAMNDNKMAGNLSNCGCFSFYPTKHITSFEGGMITTNDKNVAAAAQSMRAFGYDKTLNERKTPGLYDIASLGWNYRMSEGHAAVGKEQLRRIDEFLLARKENSSIIKNQLNGFNGIHVFPDESGHSRSSWYCVNIMIPSGFRYSRNDCIKLLNDDGIGTSIHYPVALPLSNYHKEKFGYREQQFPNAQAIAKQTISLPCAPHVNVQDAQRIVDTVKMIMS